MVTFYGVPLSVHTRKVIVAAIAKGIDYRVEPVIPFQPPEGWLKISPSGLIPIMDHDGFLLSDSLAIAFYLERYWPTPRLLPTGDREAATALSLDAFAGGVLFRRVIQPLFYQHVIKPRLLGASTDPDAVETLLTKERPYVFGVLEAQAGEGLLDPAQLTLPGISIASNLINYLYLGFSLEDWPRLDTFARAMMVRREFQRALAAERPFAGQMGLSDRLI